MWIEEAKRGKTVQGSCVGVFCFSSKSHWIFAFFVSLSLSLSPIPTNFMESFSRTESVKCAIYGVCCCCRRSQVNCVTARAPFIQCALNLKNCVEHFEHWRQAPLFE